MQTLPHSHPSSNHSLARGLARGRARSEGRGHVRLPRLSLVTLASIQTLAAMFLSACGGSGDGEGGGGPARPKPEARVPESSASAFPQAYMSERGEVMVFLEGGGVHTGLPRTGALGASACPVVIADSARCGSLASGVAGRGSVTVRWTKGAPEPAASSTFSFASNGVSFAWEGATYVRARVPKENELTGTFEKGTQTLVLYGDGRFDSRGLEVFGASVSGGNPRTRKVVGKWSIAAGALALEPAFGETRILAVLVVPPTAGVSPLARVSLGDTVFERK